MRMCDWSSDVCSSDLAALVPAPAPNIVINDVPVLGFDGTRQQILERAHTGPMIADDVRQLVRFKVELLDRQPEMISERIAKMIGPGRRGGELHDAGQIVTTLHACSLCCCPNCWRCAATMRETVGSLTP